MRKRIGIIIFGIFITVFACFQTGCLDTSTTTQTYDTKQDTKTTINIANKLAANQPTPTDIDYSLERYNLIRRAYWVNGQREKANTLVCAVEKPLGYVVLFTDAGGVVGSFVVDGKVSSLNSYLTPDSEWYEQEYWSDGDSRSGANDWLADVDGSYGENDNGIFFFDVMGNYIEWTGTYLYTDIPMIISDPVIKFNVEYEEFEQMNVEELEETKLEVNTLEEENANE